MKNQISAEIQQKQNVFTTEAVSEGHPDKIADQIAEEILDFVLQKDENAHLSCDVFVTHKLITVGGEIKSNFNWDHNIETEIKKAIWYLLKEKIGYNTQSWKEFDQLKIQLLFKQQSLEIDQLVSKKRGQVGAGDNCTVFGYANKDPYNFPIFQSLGSKVLKKISDIRKNDKFLQDKLKFAPDGKIQIIYQEDVLIKIVLCQQFLCKWEKSEQENIKEIIKTKIVEPILEELKVKNDNYNLKLVAFQSGGPESDSGLTGRKLIVDTYGTGIVHGGGCLSGKDPTKTDKTLALFARYVAKHIINLNLASEITLQISSTIGETNLVNISFLPTNETRDNQEQIKKIITKFFYWNIEQIIENLQLKKQKYSSFASYGYFGPNAQHASWEKLDLLSQIQKKLFIAS